jgi:diguanylate cyclase (GGDEF)-like protein
LFLGAVVLLAHQTSGMPDSNAAARWFFAASACGATGLMLQAERGHLPALWSVIAGNVLFLLLTVLLTRSIALTVQAATRWMPYLLAMVAVTVALLAYYTFWQPDVTRRVLIASVALPMMLAPALGMLLRARQDEIRVATRTLAGIFLLFMLGCLMRVVSIAQGAQPKSGASWAGAVLIAGVALCFLWMDLLRLRAELGRLALTDSLTALSNRRAMEMFGEREVARAARAHTALTLLTIDIDRFKNINDEHGHMIGDKALMGVASVLKETVRAGDMAARTGGDEFAVLLTGSSVETAERVVQRVCELLRALQLTTHEGSVFEVSVTIGRFTMVPHTHNSYADLVHASDIDLYERKQRRPGETAKPRRFAGRRPSPGGSR